MSTRKLAFDLLMFWLLITGTIMWVSTPTPWDWVGGLIVWAVMLKLLLDLHSKGN